MAIKFFIFINLFFSITFISISQDNTNFFSNAIKKLEEGDTSIAKVYFESAYQIQKEPKGLIYLFVLKCIDALNTQNTNTKKTHYLNAEKLFSDFYSKQPNDAARYLTVFFSLREQISRNTKLLDDIINDLSILIGEERNNEVKSELHILKGHFLICNRNPGLSITEYQAALDLYPKNYNKITFYISKAYTNLSYDLELNNSLDSALVLINNSLTLDPFYPRAYYMKGRIFYKKDMLDSALIVINQAIMLDTNYRDALILRADILYKKEYWVSAIRDYSSAIRIETNSKLYSYRGFAYLNLEKNVEAKADFTKAIELGMQDAFTYYNRGLACLGLEEYEQAIDDITKSLTYDTAYVFSFLNRAFANEQLHRYIDAIRDYTIALDKVPNETLALYNRGSCYLILKKYEDAIADFSKCIELTSYPDALLKRSETYLLANNKVKAVADLNTYLTLTTVTEEQKNKVKKILDSLK